MKLEKRELMNEVTQTD